MSLIDISNVEVSGWKTAIRGMRNSRQSYEKSDTDFIDLRLNPNWDPNDICDLGPNDLELASKLAKLGGSHAKFRRMIHVQMDIAAPFYWWKEFDTYKVGTTANSTSTMYSIAKKEFEVNNFAISAMTSAQAGLLLFKIIETLNELRDLYLKADNQLYKNMYWKDMIQMLPCSYKQLRTVDLNYEVIAHICKERKNHKLIEWKEFCEEMEKLPYANELIFCGGEK